MIGIQSVRVAKSAYTLKEAQARVEKMGFKLGVRPNPQYKNWRAFRQLQPEKFKPNSFRTKIINKHIHLIIGDLKSK